MPLNRSLDVGVTRQMLKVAKDALIRNQRRVI
jgi:hypothetical protein